MGAIDSERTYNKHYENYTHYDVYYCGSFLDETYAPSKEKAFYNVWFNHFKSQGLFADWDDFYVEESAPKKPKETSKKLSRLKEELEDYRAKEKAKETTSIQEIDDGQLSFFNDKGEFNISWQGTEDSYDTRK